MGHDVNISRAAVELPVLCSVQLRQCGFRLQVTSHEYLQVRLCPAEFCLVTNLAL